ncbi:MAG: leucine-rich repeat domain-containing protein, partial [Eubacterium sp.]|nr:leucine-rich repeat domain-containing protein [Eubacterium sp.]
KGKTNGDGKVQAGETSVTELGTFTAKSDKAAVYTPSEAAKKKESVVIPDAVKIDSNDVPVTIIDKNAFKGADLKSVTIGKNVTTISEGAFMNAKKLAKVTYKGKAVTTIGKNAFNGDKALKSMDLSKQKKLKTIGAGALKNCKKLKTIKIYANKIKKINKTAFKGCPNKKTTKVIIYAKNKTQYNKVVKMVKKAGLKKAKFKFKKAK